MEVTLARQFHKNSTEGLFPDTWTQNDRSTNG